jgi:hypothetical protein
MPISLHSQKFSHPHSNLNLSFTFIESFNHLLNPMKHMCPVATPIPANSADLRSLIAQFIQNCELQLRKSVALTDISSQYGIKMRRLYDIINIFSALGCCSKPGQHCVTWTGLVNLTSHLHDAGRTRGLDQPGTTLTSLFRSPYPFGMGNLCVDFLLLYAALGTRHLDLRMAATLFSSGARKFRSTLCKLYQIAFILCPAGVTAQTDQPRQVALRDPYIHFEVLPLHQTDYSNPLDISTMLNRQPNPSVDRIYRRREEFRGIWAASGNNSVSLNPRDFPGL